LLGDFIEVEARALRERDQDDLVKGRFAVAALAPARLAFGRDQAELLVVRSDDAGTEVLSDISRMWISSSAGQFHSGHNVPDRVVRSRSVGKDPWTAKPRLMHWR